MKCFGAYHINNATLMLSSSGGAGTAFAEGILASDGIVYGVAFKDGFKGAQYMKVSTKEQLPLIQGTKYVRPSLTLPEESSVFDDVLLTLQQKDVLFTGLPCHVAALKKTLERKTFFHKLYTVDLICQGPATDEILSLFVNELSEKYGSPLSSLSFRYKDPSCEKPFLRAEFENGKSYIKKLSDTDFWKGFCNIKPESCYSCKFKGETRVADVTMGDFWGISPENENYNKSGNSVLFVHTVNGEELINKTSLLKTYPIEQSLAEKNNPMYRTSVFKSIDYHKFKNALNKNGLEFAAKNGYTLKTKLHRLKIKFLGR